MPDFYKIDISEIPVLLGTFAMGPLAGVMTECIKILLNFVINGTTTGGIGELANFLIGCSFCVPAGLIYKRMHTRKGALTGLVTGTVIMVLIGCLLNAFVLLPTYAAAFGIPLDTLVQMGHALNPAINGVTTFVILAVGPFNLIKGLLVSIILLLIYKKVSPISMRKPLGEKADHIKTSAIGGGFCGFTGKQGILRKVNIVTGERMSYNFHIRKYGGK